MYRNGDTLTDISKTVARLDTITNGRATVTIRTRSVRQIADIDYKVLLRIIRPGFEDV